MKYKKGEMTTQQIVILIVAIVSFAVILFFMFRLNLGETTDEELCHNSVITRGSSVVPSDALPLKCHRKYVCINNGGDCIGLTNPEKIEVESLPEIYATLADEMANCWWMFGEGRVNYVGDGLTKDNYCSICSQIYFDESLDSLTNGNIDQNKLYEFLRDNKMDKTNSYLEYLFGTNDLEAMKKDASQDKEIGNFDEIVLGNQYFVTMGITNEYGRIYQIAGAIGVVGAFIVGVSPVGWVGGAIVLGVSVVAAVGGEDAAGKIEEKFEQKILAITVKGRNIKNEFMAPTIIEVNSEKFEALNCEKILTLA